MPDFLLYIILFVLLILLAPVAYKFVRPKLNQKHAKQAQLAYARSEADAAKEAATAHYSKLTLRLNHSENQDVELRVINLPATKSEMFVRRYNVLTEKYQKVNTDYLNSVNAPARMNDQSSTIDYELEATKYKGLSSRLNEIDTALTQLFSEIDYQNGLISSDGQKRRRDELQTAINVDRGVLGKLTLFSTAPYSERLQALESRLREQVQSSTDDWQSHETLEVLKADQVSLSREIHSLRDTQQQLQEAFKYHLPKKIESTKDVIRKNVTNVERQQQLNDKVSSLENELADISQDGTCELATLLTFKKSLSAQLEDVIQSCRQQSSGAFTPGKRRPR